MTLISEKNEVYFPNLHEIHRETTETFPSQRIRNKALNDLLFCDLPSIFQNETCAFLLASKKSCGVGMFLGEYPKFVPPCTLTYMGCIGLYRVKGKILKEQIALF